MHVITNTIRDKVSNTYMFLHRAAILRQSTRTKEYKPNTLTVGIVSLTLEWLKY
jgi:hypothetical protein